MYNKSLNLIILGFISFNLNADINNNSSYKCLSCHSVSAIKNFDNNIDIKEYLYHRNNQLKTNISVYDYINDVLNNHNILKYNSFYKDLILVEIENSEINVIKYRELSVPFSINEINNLSQVTINSNNKIYQYQLNNNFTHLDNDIKSIDYNLIDPFGFNFNGQIEIEGCNNTTCYLNIPFYYEFKNNIEINVETFNNNYVHKIDLNDFNNINQIDNPLVSLNYGYYKVSLFSEIENNDFEEVSIGVLNNLKEVSNYEWDMMEIHDLFNGIKYEIINN